LPFHAPMEASGSDLIYRMHADPCAPGCALAVSSPQHERHAASRRGSHSSIAASAEPIGSQVRQHSRPER
jgi:hypothetical protein